MPSLPFCTPRNPKRQRVHSPSISSPSNFQHLVHVSKSEIHGSGSWLLSSNKTNGKLEGVVTRDDISKPSNFKHIVDGRKVLQKLSHATRTITLRRLTHPAIKRTTRLTAKDISPPSNFVHLWGVPTMNSSTPVNPIHPGNLN